MHDKKLPDGVVKDIINITYGGTIDDEGNKSMVSPLGDLLEKYTAHDLVSCIKTFENSIICNLIERYPPKIRKQGKRLVCTCIPQADEYWTKLEMIVKYNEEKDRIDYEYSVHDVKGKCWYTKAEGWHRIFQQCLTVEHHEWLKRRTWITSLKRLVRLMPKGVDREEALKWLDKAFVQEVMDE